MREREEVRDGARRAISTRIQPTRLHYLSSYHWLEHPYWPLQIQTLHTILSTSLSLMSLFCIISTFPYSDWHYL